MKIVIDQDYLETKTLPDLLLALAVEALNPPRVSGDETLPDYIAARQAFYAIVTQITGSDWADRVEVDLPMKQILEVERACCRRTP